MYGFGQSVILNMTVSSHTFSPVRNACSVTLDRKEISYTQLLLP